MILQNRDARHLAFPARSKAICVERDAESEAYLHEKAVVEQFKLLQPLFKTGSYLGISRESDGGLTFCFPLTALPLGTLLFIFIQLIMIQQAFLGVSHWITKHMLMRHKSQIGFVFPVGTAFHIHMNG